MVGAMIAVAGFANAAPQPVAGDKFPLLSLMLPDRQGPHAFSTATIPEPTTIVAGILLLLPFAASTLRILRKTRAAQK